MDEIVFHCTNCGAKLSGGADEIGEAFDCPSCGAEQTVPGDNPAAAEEPAAAPASVQQAETIADVPAGRVIKIPKKKIVLSHEPDYEEMEEELEEELEEEIEEEIGGSGLRVFSMAVGTAGVFLCGVSLIWAVFARDGDHKDWWFMLLTFTSTFLLALMGLVLAQVAFRVERIAAHVRHMHAKEEL